MDLLYAPQRSGQDLPYPCFHFDRLPGSTDRLPCVLWETPLVVPRGTPGFVGQGRGEIQGADRGWQGGEVFTVLDEGLDV